MLSGINATHSPMANPQYTQKPNQQQLLADAIAALPLTLESTHTIKTSPTKPYLNDPDAFLNDECILPASGPYAHAAVYRRDIYDILWQYKPKRLSQQQLHWLIREDAVLQRFQDELSTEQRKRFLQASLKSSRCTALKQLWQACLKRLNLKYNTHLDEQQRYATFLTNFQHKPKILEQPFNSTSVQFFAEHLLQREGQHQLDKLLDHFAWQKTLRDSLQSLTGEDIAQTYLPQLITQLQQWPSTDRNSLSFYPFFRQSANREQQIYLISLAKDPLEAIMTLFADMALPSERWRHYLKHLWHSWPEWTDYFMQRATNIHQMNENSSQLTDAKSHYLAVCLFLEYMAAQELCHSIWQREPGMDALYQYFHASPYELIIRCALYNEPNEDALPETLFIEAQTHLAKYTQQSHHDTEDEALAHKIFAWKQYSASGTPEAYNITEHAWLLFVLAQHLGLAAHVIEKLRNRQLHKLFDCLTRYREYTGGQIV